MAKFKQGECSQHMRLKNVEPTMGMFHLEVTVVQRFKCHFGKDWDLRSLHMWTEELSQDYRKMWDDTQKGQVKDFRASRDALFLVLRGYVMAAVAVEINTNYTDLSLYTKGLAYVSQSELAATIDTVSNYCSDFGYVQKLRSVPDDDRD